MPSIDSQLSMIDENSEIVPLRPKTKKRVIYDPDKIFKQLIWAYFVLLIFEGGLRKWVLPQLSTPLLVVRDPIAVYLLFLAWKRDAFPINHYVIIAYAVAIIAIPAALLVGHGSIGVALFGARVFLIHFPLIFVIGRILNRDDIIAIGKTALWISIFMTLLIGIQFYSPQSAWVNRGLAGDTEGSGFSGAKGFFRVPGTFSFTAGLGLFYGFVAAYVMYFWLNPTLVKRPVLIIATVGLIAAIPLSISRTILSEVILSSLFAVIAVSGKPKLMSRVILAVIGVLLFSFILGKASFFQTASDAFSSRFESASESEGGVEGTLVTRVLGGYTNPILQIPETPFFGNGIGMGTNVGAKLLTGDQNVFLISEGEWGRLIGEMGPILGLLAIFIRTQLAFKLFNRSYKRRSIEDTLPLLLFSFALINIINGQWGVPTSLGFGTLIAGLNIAALKNETVTK